MNNLAEIKEIKDMVKAIYNHLGIDGRKPVDINQVRKEAEKDVLKFAEKRKESQKTFRQLYSCEERER